MAREVALAVELHLDDAARHDVGLLLSQLADAGVTPITASSPHAHPHVSLTVSEGASVADLVDALGGVGDDGLPDLTLSSVGMFTAPAPVLFLGVTPTTELLALHRRVHGRVASIGSWQWPLYAPAFWVPHCTLAMRPRSLADAAFLLAAAPLPIEARAVAIRVVEVPTGKALAEIG
jgi:2'-5' RNA ligase